MIPSARLLARSVWKGPHIVPLPIAKVSGPSQAIRTNARSCTILPVFVGKRFQVHNGKEYVEFIISEDMVGRKLGEFAPTRQRFTYKATKNK